MLSIQTADKKKVQEIYPWLVLVASGLLMSLLEYTYTLLFGLFLNPLAKSLNSKISIVSLYYTLLSFSIALMLPVVNKIINRIDLNKILLVAVLICTISMWIFSIINYVWELYVLAIIVGICSSTCGTVVQGIILNNWFFKKKNFAFTLGSFISTIYLLIMTPLLAYLISSFGWRNSMLFLSLLTIILGIPCALIMRCSPENVGIKPYGFENQQVRNTVLTESKNLDDFQEVMFTHSFGITLIFFIAITFASNMSQLFPTYAVKVGFGTQIGGLMETVMTGTDIIITPLFAFSTEKFGGKKLLPIWTFFGLLTFPLLIWATIRHRTEFALMGAVCADILTDIYGPGEQIFAKDVLGKNFAMGYSCINTITYLIGAFAVPVVSLIYECFLNWNIVFIFGILLLLVMLLMLFLGYHRITSY